MASITEKSVLVLVAIGFLLQVQARSAEYDLDPRRHLNLGIGLSAKPLTSFGARLLEGQPKGWLESLETYNDDERVLGDVSPLIEEESIRAKKGRIADEENGKERTMEKCRTQNGISDIRDALPKRAKRYVIPLAKSATWKSERNRGKRPQNQWNHDGYGALSISNDDVMKRNPVPKGMASFTTSLFPHLSLPRGKQELEIPSHPAIEKVAKPWQQNAKTDDGSSAKAERSHHASTSTAAETPNPKSATQDLQRRHFDSEEDGHFDVATSLMPGSDEKHLQERTHHRASPNREDGELMCVESFEELSVEDERKKDKVIINKRSAQTNKQIGEEMKDKQTVQRERKDVSVLLSMRDKRSLRIRPIGKVVINKQIKSHPYRQPRKIWSKRRYYTRRRNTQRYRNISIKKRTIPMASPALLVLFPELYRQK